MTGTPSMHVDVEVRHLPVDQTWIDAATLDECIDAWLPDFIAALERPLHPDADPLMAAACQRVRDSYQDTYADQVGDGPEDIDAGELLVAQEQTIQILLGCARWIVDERSR